jgi:putative tryptophan/tyrosine transport system substrate-binding protein
VSTAARRAIVLLVVLITSTLAAHAQPRSKTVRVGVLAGGGPGFHAGLEPFRQRLRDLGHREGPDFVLDVRDADGHVERYPTLAAELVRLNPDVIVVQGNAALTALKAATSTIPIVMASIGDPVGAGFVASLARPGGNITGTSNMYEGVSGKWVELLKEMIPSLTRVGVLGDTQNVAHSRMRKEVEEAARRLAITPVARHVVTGRELAEAFARMADDKVRAVILLPQPGVGANLRPIVDLSVKHHLATMYPNREFALAGGLMGYGPSVADQWRRSAEYVDKILRGAKPAELPVAQPTTFELVVNRKAASALGLTIPPALLVRADHVVE